jgi:molybdate transport system ATP-binding protein
MATFELIFALRQGAFALEIASAISARAVALFGPSGSGKTTIVEAVAGLRTPRQGRIAVNSRLLFDSDAHVNLPPRDRRVGYVPQDALLFPHMNVRSNILYGRRNGGPVALPRLADLLELGPLMTRDVASLSGGERQRAAIARALLSGPDVLLLDEPLAAVDAPRRQRITTALLRIRDELGVPIVYVTHAIDEAVAVAEHAIVLDAGRVVASGPARDVLH